MSHSVDLSFWVGDIITPVDCDGFNHIFFDDGSTSIAPGDFVFLVDASRTFSKASSLKIVVLLNDGSLASRYVRVDCNWFENVSRKQI